jgi:hypothetical protein
VLDDGPEGQHGEVGEADHDDDDAGEQPGEERRAGGEGAGTGCLRASEPAMARAGTMSRNRPMSIDAPSVVLYQSVLPVRPPKAEPLLLAAEVKA